MNHPVWRNAWIEAWSKGMNHYDRSRYAWKVYESYLKGIANQ